MIERLSSSKLSRIGVAAAQALAVGTLVGLLTSCQPKTAAPEVVETPQLEVVKPKAEQGDASAQAVMGDLYAKGLGVKQDYAEAAKWYRLAADQGLAEAQYALGDLYEVGRGVKQDLEEAARLYRQAAEQGHVVGQYCLAILYVTGRGVPQDIPEAVKWYRQAADQGDALAQLNLGIRYKEGNGVPADPVEAYKWLTLAANQKIEDATRARDELKRSMTREQIAEGRKRAEAFVPRKQSPPTK